MQGLNMKVIQCLFHRNGISGIGFYAIEFQYVEDGEEYHSVATVDGSDVELFRKNKPHNPGTRVLMLDEAGGVDLEKTMRGDHFHEELCRFVMQWQDKKAYGGY